jgi:hypothetical protein
VLVLLLARAVSKELARDARPQTRGLDRQQLGRPSPALLPRRCAKEDQGTTAAREHCCQRHKRAARSPPHTARRRYSPPSQKKALPRVRGNRCAYGVHDVAHIDLERTMFQLLVVTNKAAAQLSYLGGAGVEGGQGSNDYNYGALRGPSILAPRSSLLAPRLLSSKHS